MSTKHSHSTSVSDTIPPGRGERVAVALSGGVDSAVAARLLKEAGYDPFGVYMRLGNDARESETEAHVRSICGRIGIPLEIVPLQETFQHHVIHYFKNAYLRGKTPNPCVVCNPAVKFGALLRWAREKGASRLATGHYARIRRDPESGCLLLLKGVDPAKDQSYFLHRLTQDRLQCVLFPVGGLCKQETRRLAREAGILPLTLKESREFCFLKDRDYRSVLETEPRLPPPGAFVDRQGSVLGTHKGIHRYTIGQRRGLGIPSSEPYYVLSIDAASNRIVLGRERDLYQREAVAEAVHWVGSRPSSLPLRCSVRIRYRHREAPAEVVLSEGGTVRIRFDSPQRAVTPGQAAVFYLGEVVLGGGWLTEVPA